MSEEYKKRIDRITSEIVELKPDIDKEKFVSIKLAEARILGSASRWKTDRDNAAEYIHDCVSALKRVNEHIELPFDIEELKDAVESALGKEAATIKRKRELGSLINAFVCFGCPQNQIINAIQAHKGERGFGKTYMKSAHNLFKSNLMREDILSFHNVHKHFITQFFEEIKAEDFPSNKARFPDVYDTYEFLKQFFNDKYFSELCHERIKCKSLSEKDAVISKALSYLEKTSYAQTKLHHFKSD